MEIEVSRRKMPCAFSCAPVNPVYGILTNGEYVLGGENFHTKRWTSGGPWSKRIGSKRDV